MPVLAQVAIQGATLTYDKLYSYRVPTPMEGHIFVGSMVLVPFGRGQAKPRMAVVLSLEEAEAAGGKLKDIAAAAPEDARLTRELLAIVRYLHEATFCTWYDAVRAVIPYGAQYKPMQTADGGWQLQKQLRRYTETVFRFVAGPAEMDGKLTQKQQTVLELVRRKECSKAEILERCGVGPTVAEKLVEKGLLQKAERDIQLQDVGLFTGEAYEGGLGVRAESDFRVPDLNPAQSEVAAALKGRIAREEAGKPALLYGVTGSGKTAVFLALIRACLEKGKTALVLVPEIGLTPQMITGLRGAFGNRVAVQHSALSNTERLLQWRQIQRGEADVVVGTRSAVFAPLENIGILIVDEEHERSYQSESNPRYDALEIAKKRAAYHKAVLLLASATPSVADYHAAMTGRYDLYRLEERYGSLPLPTVEMVDMRGELQSGNPGGVSGRLAAEIAKNLQVGSQTILLLNKRGYHRVGICRECNETVRCGDYEAYVGAGDTTPGCSVPMVYHKAGNRLLCHYCGRTLSPPPDTCPKCGGEIRYAGFGTQRLEDELAEKFPTARVLRLDLDSTSRKGSHAEMLARFAAGEYDILLGTQMVAKGLDFERVSLVGVIGIDSLLFSQGYRAYETVFSLVTQVVGRSGRSGSPGRAMIQTSDPENPILNLAARQDYDSFYRQEIAFRKLALYPPWCSICVVGFQAAEEGEVLKASRRFGVLLVGCAKDKPGIPLRILGPAPMGVAQVAGKTRYRLTVKCRNDAAFRALAMETLRAYNKEGWARRVPVTLDFHSDAGT